MHYTSVVFGRGDLLKQVVTADGVVRVEEVPAPCATPGRVLVEVAYSAISAGTELKGVNEASEPLWRRAIRNPEKVKSLFAKVRQDGLGAARAMVSSATSQFRPMGYSAAGVVVEDGTGTYSIGERIACAGAQCAHHAEVISVPENLAVSVPEEVSLQEAGTVALGAIALQGVRRLAPTIGESFVVIGLGIIGQLAAQILRVGGCRVIGADPDASRTSLAKELGTNLILDPSKVLDIDAVARLTGGVGADGVLVAASSSSDEIMSAAFQMCRKKGRVVLIGDVGLDLRRDDFYSKELDFFISSSYGPGRYDRTYEEESLDYPIGHVRWTENRNMSEYLRQIAEGKVTVKPLITDDFSVEEAPRAYAAFTDHDVKPLIVTLSYPKSLGARKSLSVSNPAARPLKRGTLGIGVIGAGGFASSVHLPNITAAPGMFSLVGVAARQGHSAAATARRFGARYSTTDVDKILNDESVDAVLITTRHDLHGLLVLKALEAGKHVLVEKPLAIRPQELNEIKAFFDRAGPVTPVLLTGFNRRFSRFARALKAALDRRQGAAMLTYRMNAGYQPPDHWVHGSEGGGRNIGEACHVYDLFGYLLDSKVESVTADAICPASDYYQRNDNFVASVRFDDGSLASLTYTALGTSALPKERLESFWDCQVAVLDNYTSLEFPGGAHPPVTARTIDKGHREELRAFGKCIIDGGDWPIPLWQQIQATEISFEVEAAIGGGAMPAPEL